MRNLTGLGSFVGFVAAFAASAEIAPPRDEGYPTAPPYGAGAANPTPVSSPTRPPTPESGADEGTPSYEKSGIEYRLARCFSSADNSSLVIQFNAVKREGRLYSKVQHTGGRGGAFSFEAETSLTETHYPQAHLAPGSELNWVLMSDAGHLLRLMGSQNAPYGAVISASAWLYPPGSGQYVQYGCTVMGMARLNSLFDD